MTVIWFTYDNEKGWVEGIPLRTGQKYKKIITFPSGSELLEMGFYYVETSPN